MKVNLCSLTYLLFSLNFSYAQNAKLITAGDIEYNKTVNMYAVLPRVVPRVMAVQAIDQYKKTQPQFLIMKSTLTFTREKTLFEPLPMASSENIYNTHPVIAQNNIVYTDLNAKRIISQKNILGESVLVKDDARVIKWKITDETREIAGYHCRRANAIIMDSIYVVAFYTSDIPSSGGPESFTGLPGMILQVAIPHENISWIATKVTEKDVSALKPPDIGKIYNIKELYTLLVSALQRFGDLKQAYLKALFL